MHRNFLEVNFDGEKNSVWEGVVYNLKMTFKDYPF